MSWQSICLGDCIELVSGAAFKSAMFTENSDDIPLVKGENIGQGEILWEKARYWPSAQFDEYSKLALKPGDVVLAMDRPWVTAGLKYAIIAERDPISLLVQRVARIRPLPNADAKFLKHIVGSREFLEYIKGIMGGTNVPHISGRQIKDFRCRLPDLETQQRIAAVLSAYDDLIDNNRRRIALLEDAARQLYKEWFVRFRFPGHEHVKLIGGVPLGWEMRSLDSLAAFLNGFAFKPHHLGDKGLPIVKIPELKGGILEKTPRYDGEDVPDKYLLTTSDLIFSWSGTLAIDFWCNGTAYLNQHLFKVLPFDGISAAHLLIAIREAMPLFENQTVGATMKHIRRSALSGVKIAMPPEALYSNFRETLDPIYDQIVVLRQLSASAAKARDLLLPKLMNGTLAV